MVEMPKTPVVITGVFNDVTQDDVDTLGQEWFLQNDPEYGNCAKFQIRWGAPDESGVKYSFSNKLNDWKKGGLEDGILFFKVDYLYLSD